MKTLLWLDDYRNPLKMDSDWLVFSPIGRNCKVYWVKSYTQFVKWISERGLPDGICFDHDLGVTNNPTNPNNDKTGYDCAKWLVEYCQDKDLLLPLWNCQSANPVGKDNINLILNNYKKFYESKSNQ